jgi:hypothetical protein
MDDHELVPLRPARHRERSPRRSDSADSADADATAMTRGQKAVALAAYRHWRRLTDARLHDVDTLQALLPSIGEPVKELTDFWNYFATGRVIVQAHIKRNRPPSSAQRRRCCTL